VTLHALEHKVEGGQHDGAPVYAPPVFSRRAGADRVRVWSGRSVVLDGTAHHSPDRGQATWLEQRPMRQHGSMQPGTQALSLAALLEHKGGKHPASSCALAYKLLATKGINW